MDNNPLTNPLENKPLVPQENALEQQPTPLGGVEIEQTAELSDTEKLLSPELTITESEPSPDAVAQPVPLATAESVINTASTNLAGTSIESAVNSSEKHLSEILENKDFKKESPHDAMEDILNASQSAQ